MSDSPFTMAGQGPKIGKIVIFRHTPGTAEDAGDSGIRNVMLALPSAANGAIMTTR